MKREITIFFTAVMFYTRIPCPKNITHDPEYLNKATRYFPFIGWIVGGIMGVVFYFLTQNASLEIGVILSMVTGILLTGAFHEDGFADVCDGFGGGWTQEKILKIMKDSAIGAYGAIGLILLFLLKFFLMIQLFQNLNDFKTIVLVFICAHAVSRLNAASLIFTDNYVREDELSKSKPIAKKHTWKEVIGALFFGILPLVYLATQNYYYLFSIATLLMTRSYFSYYFKKWIGGYTGDCLGALQQISEVVFYLTLLIICKYI